MIIINAFVFLIMIVNITQTHMKGGVVREGPNEEEQVLSQDLTIW